MFYLTSMIDLSEEYTQIILASLVIIISFFFGEVSKKTNIPSVLLLIILGILGKIAMEQAGIDIDPMPVLKALGAIGLIMIVLEAALELELKYEKLWPILKAFGIALVGLVASTWIAAYILHENIDGMSMEMAWIYATPLSVLSSAIIIPSVESLSPIKKEFHVYESTFSDIIGIMLFYFLIDKVQAAPEDNVVLGFFGNLGLTIVISVVASYVLILIFQKISSHAKLFLLISVLLLLYSLGKKIHLSPLIIILTFGLTIGNVSVFFRGKLNAWLDKTKAKELYEDLHIVTVETAFVVRTFFFVIFGLSISLASLLSLKVAIISGLILLSIYVIRFVTLRLLLGKDIVPQLFIAPRGLITVLLFYAIPDELKIAGFDAGILLFIIIATSVFMTFALIYDKRRKGKAIDQAKGVEIGYSTWKAPVIEEEK